MKGNPDNVMSFEWNEEYQDFINRFEGWVNIEDIKDVDELYDKTKDWLSHPAQPTQKQMDFFTEYYQQPHFNVSEAREIERETEEPKEYFHEYKDGSMYNETTGRFDKRIDQHTYETYDRTSVSDVKLNYGTRKILRDSKTGRFLKHIYDVDKDEYLE